LQFVVTEHLYKNSKGDEGDLTRIRAEMVSKTPLLDMVRKLGIDQDILLCNGQGHSTNSTDKMYSSLYETVVAGIYLDGGIKEAKKFIEKTLINEYLKKPKKTVNKVNVNEDYKSQLQEYVQKTKIGSIGYETLYKIGPDHKPEFKIAVLLNGSKIAEAKGGSKKEAEFAGAKKALAKLKKQGGKQK
jgi:ribonuclease-3